MQLIFTPSLRHLLNLKWRRTRRYCWNEGIHSTSHHQDIELNKNHCIVYGVLYIECVSRFALTHSGHVIISFLHIPCCHIIRMLTFLLDFWCYCVVGCNCCPFSRSWCSAFVVLDRMWPHLLWGACSMFGLCVMILYFIESPNFEICLWLWREERVFSGNGLCKMVADVW